MISYLHLSIVTAINWDKILRVDCNFIFLLSISLFFQGTPLEISSKVISKLCFAMLLFKTSLQPSLLSSESFNLYTVLSTCLLAFRYSPPPPHPHALLPSTNQIFLRREIPFIQNFIHWFVKQMDIDSLRSTVKEGDSAYVGRSSREQKSGV